MPKGSSQTTRAEPWLPIQKNLKNLRPDITLAGNEGELVARPADFTSDTRNAFQMMRGLAGNDGVTGDARSALRGMLNGDGQAAVRDSIMAEITPQVASTFGQGGFVNSTAAQGAFAKEAARALAPFEYDSKFQAIGLAPTIQDMGFQDAAALRAIGADRENLQTQKTGVRGDNIAREAELFALLGGMGGTQTGQQNPGALETLGGLGGALSSGALAFSLLCDERLKRDTEWFGEWKGVALYMFRYFFDDEWRIGPKAQEVPERARIELPTGFYAVDMGAL